MSDLTHGFVSIALAIVGVALLAVLVSRNANTSGILNSGGNAFANVLQAAEAPVTGHVGNSVTGPGFYN